MLLCIVNSLNPTHSPPLAVRGNFPAGYVGYVETSILERHARPGTPPKKTREPLDLIFFQLRSGQLFESGVDQATKIDVKLQLYATVICGQVTNG